MNPTRWIMVLLIASLLVAAVAFYRSGNSVCWIAQSETVRQIQFAPYYWHSNRLRAARIESVSAVLVPQDPERRALRVASPRTSLLYRFAHDGWIRDIEGFATEVEAVVAGDRRIACRIRVWTWVFGAAVAMALTSLVALAAVGMLRALRGRVA